MAFFVDSSTKLQHVKERLAFLEGKETASWYTTTVQALADFCDEQAAALDRLQVENQKLLDERKADKLSLTLAALDDLKQAIAMSMASKRLGQKEVYTVCTVCTVRPGIPLVYGIYGSQALADEKLALLQKYGHVGYVEPRAVL